MFDEISSSGDALEVTAGGVVSSNSSNLTLSAGGSYVVVDGTKTLDATSIDRQSAAGITIGGTNANAITIGRTGVTTGVAGDLELAGSLIGPDDGSGFIVGQAGTSSPGGSALQVASFTSTEQGYLTAADGMIVYNATANQLQGRVNGTWVDLGATGGSGFWSRTGTIVYPTTTTDEVVVGGSALAGTEQFRVVGDAYVDDNIYLGPTGGNKVVQIAKQGPGSGGNTLTLSGSEGGDSTTGASGGETHVLGADGGVGSSGAGGRGGDVNVFGGDGGTGTTNTGSGGAVEVQGGTGDGATGGGNVSVEGGVSLNASGGDVTILGGSGSTQNGRITIAVSNTRDLFLGAQSGTSSPCITTINYGVTVRDGASAEAYLELQPGQNGPVAPAGTGRLRYNGSTNVFEYSENGVAWAQAFGGSGSSPWTQASGVIYPTTITDDVAIGTTTMSSTERLRVAGHVSFGGNLAFEQSTIISTPKGTGVTGFQVAIYPGDGQDAAFSSGRTGGNLVMDSGDGGDVVSGGGNGGDAGDISIIGGTGGNARDGASFTGGDGAEVTIEAGIGGGPGFAGDDTNGGLGGDLNLGAGRGGATSSGNGGTAGSVIIYGGNAVGGLQAGAAGAVSITGGDGALSSTGTDTVGGSVTIAGGVGALTGTANGGNVVINGGEALGTGTDGQVQVGGTNTSQVLIGAAATPVVVNGTLQGPNDGTGVVVGHAGTGASSGSAFQAVSLTTTEQGYLVAADGMVVYNTTANQLQGRVNGAWVDLGAGGGGSSPWSRNAGTGAVYPTTTTDDVIVGGTATSGTERLRVVGGGLFEVPDNDSSAFIVRQGTDNYLQVDTTDGAELAILGNGTVTNLITALLGSQVSLGSGTSPARIGIDIPDNDSNALNLNQGSDTYLEIDTTDGSESIILGNGTVTTLATTVLGAAVNVGAPGLPADVTITIVDNEPAFVVKEGANEYINIDTSDGAELMSLGNATTNPDYVFVGSGYVQVDGNIQGPDDGTGVVFGHAGTGASTGSAFQAVSLTTTEQGYLVAADGMVVYNTTDNQLQGRVNGAWVDLGAGGGSSPWTESSGTVYPNNATDDVVIGAAAMFGTEKLRVVGSTSLQGDIVFEPAIGTDVNITGVQATGAGVNGIDINVLAPKGANDATTPGQGGDVVCRSGAGGDTTGATKAAVGGAAQVKAGTGGTNPDTGDGGDGGTLWLAGGTAGVPTGTGATGAGGNCSVRGGSGNPHGQVSIGQAQTSQINMGAVGVPTIFADVLRGTDDGTGVVFGHAGTAASEGSALQFVSVTTTERGYLVAADGMVVYNTTDNQLQGRVNGAWVDLGYTGGATGGGWTDDGAVVRLTTASDDVAIGTATMSGTEKLRVVGDCYLEGDILSTGNTRHTLAQNATAGGLGYQFEITAGTGNDNSAVSPGNGGELELNAGDGGDSTLGSALDAGNGGIVSVSGGSGGDCTGTGDGGNGGDVSIGGGWGGTSSGGGGQGIGGDVTIAGGNGSTLGQVNVGVSGTLRVNVGAATTETRVQGLLSCADDILFYAGSSRVYAGQNPTAGGLGYQLDLSAGKGGDNAAGTGGTGGEIELNAGDGGDTTNNNLGGTGGSVSVQAGRGGSTTGIDDGGVGGAVSISGGWGGTSVGGDQGGGGDVTIAGGFGIVGGDVTIVGGNGTNTDGDVYVGTSNTVSVNVGASTNVIPANFHGQVQVLDGTGATAAIDLTDGDSATAAAANHGKMRYNEAKGGIEASYNALGYQPINVPGVSSVQVTGTTSTTSTTYTTVGAGLSITPPAGRYLVMFSTSVQNTSNSHAVYVQVYVGGTAVGSSYRVHIRGNQTIWVPLMSTTVVDANGSQAIEVRWRVSGGTGNMEARTFHVQQVRGDNLLI